ncbi:transposase [Streptomyces sp. R302]|nr:transposase [Streptomyces sp. R301]NML83913.1 transposase [Streptomyces sp. R302]
MRQFLPMSNGRCGRSRDHRQVIDGILHRLRTGVHWHDLPERFGPLGRPGGLHRRARAPARGRRPGGPAAGTGRINGDKAPEHQDKTQWQSLSGRLVEVVREARVWDARAADSPPRSI